MQAIHVDQFTDLDGRGYGVRHQTAPVHPGFFGSWAPWDGAAHYVGLLESLAHTTAVGFTVRDQTDGEVRVGRDGEPVIRYRLNEADRRHARRGMEASAELLEAMGAQRIFSCHARYVGYAPGRDGDRARFMRDMDAAGWGPGQLQLNGFHLLSSCRMGGTAATSACGPEGETWDVRDLVVCDGSAFPTASGVNPNMSIQALGRLNATKLAERLGARSGAATAPAR